MSTSAPSASSSSANPPVSTQSCLCGTSASPLPFNVITTNGREYSQPPDTTQILSKHSLKIAKFSLELIINKLITDNNLDILCLTETLKENLDYNALDQTTHSGCNSLDKPHPDVRGGGIGAVYT